MHVISDLLLGTFYDMEPFKTHKILKSSNSNTITHLKEMPVKGFSSVLALKQSYRQGQESAVICTYHLFSIHIAWHLKCVHCCRCTDLEVCVQHRNVERKKNTHIGSTTRQLEFYMQYYFYYWFYREERYFKKFLNSRSLISINSRRSRC